MRGLAITTEAEYAAIEPVDATTAPKKTPLEEWIRRKVHPDSAGELTREQVERYQLEKLPSVLAYVRQRSLFYRELLAGTAEAALLDREAFSRLPFTTPADVRAQGMKLLCTSQDEIERIVTLQSSGTTGESKRLFFTAQDLELTVDFFHHGMATMVQPGETVIILLPAEKPDSVGDLLARGLGRLGVKAVRWGVVRDLEATRAEILRHESPCLVGIPTQILALVRGVGETRIPTGWVKSVLLSTDYVPRAIQTELERSWGCRVLTHYGMTETGLGGAVECEAGNGYHLREADLYTEIIDPETGAPVPDGSTGEVVFTTLSRQGMPLVRYRTGDRARLLPEPCPCGSVLRRLDRVQGRIEGEVRLLNGAVISMRLLDEALFPIDGVLNFTAALCDGDGADRLDLCIQAREGEEKQVAREAASNLLGAQPVGPLFRRGRLAIGNISFDNKGWLTTGTGKRQISDKRRRQAVL